MDKDEAHRHFSVKCFNDIWSLLEKEERSADDDRLMRETAHASLFHWLQRSDCEPKNLSVGLWLISRVYSVLGCGASAMDYADECIETSKSLEPFYVGYGFEAAARASKVLGNQGRVDSYLKRVEGVLEKISNPEERGLLIKDLEDL